MPGKSASISLQKIPEIRLHHHTVISLFGTGLIYLFFRSFSAATAFFLSGVFIDLDHICEYIYKFGIKNFSVKTFFRAAHNHEYTRFFLILHSYELAAVLWLLSLLVIRAPWAWGFTLGFTTHILIDQIYNPCHPLTYFFARRVKHNFDGDKLFPPELREKYDRRRKKVRPSRNPDSGV